jgi:hypothetical protein
MKEITLKETTKTKVCKDKNLPTKRKTPQIAKLKNDNTPTAKCHLGTILDN